LFGIMVPDHPNELCWT